MDRRPPRPRPRPGRAGRRLRAAAGRRARRAGGAGADARNEPGGEPGHLARRQVRGLPRIRGGPHRRLRPVRGRRAGGEPHRGTRPRGPDPGDDRRPRDLPGRKRNRSARGAPGRALCPPRDVAHPGAARRSAAKGPRPRERPAVVGRREPDRLHAAGPGPRRRSPGRPPGRHRGEGARRSRSGAPLPRAGLVARRGLGLFQPRAHAQQRRPHRDLARVERRRPRRARGFDPGRGAGPVADAGREGPRLRGRPVGGHPQPVAAPAARRSRAAPHPRGRGLPRAANLEGRTAPRLRGPHERRFAPCPGPARDIAGPRLRADGRGGRGRGSFVRPDRADRLQLREERNARHLDERRRRRQPSSPHLGCRDRLASRNLARREPGGLRFEPWRSPGTVGGPGGWRRPALAGAGGCRGPALLVAGRSNPGLRGRGEGRADRAVGGVRRRRCRGPHPGRPGTRPGLVPERGPDRLLHVRGLGRPPHPVHEQPRRISPGPPRRGNHPRRRLGLLLGRGSARHRHLSRIRGRRGRRGGPRERAEAHPGPAAAFHGAPRRCLDPRRRAASSTASSSTRAESFSSTASAATRASGSGRPAPARRRSPGRIPRRRVA